MRPAQIDSVKIPQIMIILNEAREITLSTLHCNECKEMATVATITEVTQESVQQKQIHSLGMKSVIV